jgi:hypothetical protein
MLHPGGSSTPFTPAACALLACAAEPQALVASLLSHSSQTYFPAAAALSEALYARQPSGFAEDSFTTALVASRLS